MIILFFLGLFIAFTILGGFKHMCLVLWVLSVCLSLSSLIYSYTILERTEWGACDSHLEIGAFAYVLPLFSFAVSMIVVTWNAPQKDVTRFGKIALASISVSTLLICHFQVRCCEWKDESVAAIEGFGGTVIFVQDKKFPVRNPIGVDLSGADISDKSLSHIKPLGNLEAVNLSNTKVSDSGLVYLRGLKKLKTLNLKTTSVTDMGVNDLQAALPDCKIVR